MKPKLLALLVASPSLTALAAAGNPPRPRSVDGDAVAPRRRRRRLATTCEFCPRGLAASPQTPVPSSGGETCGSLVEAAPTLDGDEYFCTDVVVPAEGLCCGDDSAGKGSVDGATDDDPDTDDDLRNPCPVCEGGVTEGLDKIIGRSPDGELRTCGTLMVDALKVEEGGAECDAMMGAEVRCCPPGDDEDDDEEDDKVDDEEDDKVEESGGGCPVCANGQGLTVKGDTPIPYPEANGASCEDMLEFAKDVDADGDDCAQMMRAESVCCPRPPEDPVGAADESTEDPKDAAEDAADDPCPVCEGGITVPGETVIGEAGGVTFTCGGLMVDALKEEEGGRVCRQMMAAEGLCCPPEDEDEDDDKEEDDDEKVKDPCPVCSGGITVPGDTVIGRQGGVPLTCGGLVVDALEEEEGGEVCDAMMTAEGLCCPPKEDEVGDGEDDDWEDDDERAENPCPVCPGGITVPGDTIIGKQGDLTFTCGGMVVDALEEEEDGEVCEAMMTAEGLCCPPDDDDDDEEDTPKPAEPEDVPAPTEAPEDVPAPTASPKDAPATTEPGYGEYPATPPADDDAAGGAETPATSPPDTPAPSTPNEKGVPTPAPTTHTPSYNPTVGPPPTTNAPFKAFVDPDSRPPPATEAAPPAPSNDTAVVVGPSNAGYLELNDMPTGAPREGLTSTAPTASPAGAATENLPASGPTYEGPPDISASSVVPSFASLAFAAFSILYCGAFLA